MSGRDERIEEVPKRKHGKYCMACPEKRMIYTTGADGQNGTEWFCADNCVEQYNEMIRIYMRNEERNRSTSAYVVTIPTSTDIGDLLRYGEIPYICEEMNPDRPLSLDELTEIYEGD